MTREQLFENIRRKQSFLCVGLDTDVKKVPQHLVERGEKEEDYDVLFEFNKAIIDATAPYCIAFKPNLAFYEAHGVRGWMAFEKTVEYIRAKYPDQFIIADAKRGDIGNTSKLYARTFFEHLDVDAVTVAPYMGEDSVTPFLDYPGKWVIVLALTSNKGNADFQFTTDAEGTRLYERVLTRSQQWCKPEGGAPSGVGKDGSADRLMYVVGATNAAEFANVRRLVPDHFLLVPGIGAQGGSLEEVCKHGWNDHCGLIVNSSRAIIYADNTGRFAQVAAEKAWEVQQQMAAIIDGHLA